MAAEAPQKVNGKVIVAGPAATGKTCLIERFVNDVYIADDAAHGPTLGTDCSRKSVVVDNVEVNLFLYDTAGQERFAEMAASYYRIGEVCLLCFDLSDISTFDHTKFWMNKVSDNNPKCTFILVGTKEDLVSKDDPAIQPIEAWAEEAGIPFFTTSAKLGSRNIKFLFHSVAEKCLRINREKLAGGDRQGMQLGGAFGKPKQGCCGA
eukprot:TRINITY_DN19013_c0_g1_i1.p2 TRINITY_DN19013_c0_g1~~TRINITY_DN19013_c0_g1_i1.p2  ORF type:complete len:207 (+),score=56.97 TRINITY_DN19013_c0_g1_i1:82-702(+)